jgi:Rho-binding antiterminator
MSDDLDPYKPIACDLHSEYELAIMRRVNLRLSWHDGHGQQHIGYLLPLDLYTRNHVEYLVARAIDGQQHEIRLDRITSSNVREAIAR